MTQEIQCLPLISTDKNQACEVFKITILDTFDREGIGHLAQTCQTEIAYKCALVEDALDEKKLGFTFLVAKQNDKVIGIISYGPCGDDIKRCSKGKLSHMGELGSLYVLPKYQNLGIGSRLIKAMVDVLLTQGVEQFCLDSGYPSAQKRWRMKFKEPIYVIKDYWGKGMDHCVWLCNSKDVLKSNQK